MNPILEELVAHLALERLEENLFRGPSKDIGTNRVYGGQVLGQAIKAAQYTVEEDRNIHSLHAYFLREGDHDSPIIYEVDRSRDGRSFSARRVVAIQHGRPIFTLSASFQFSEEGLEFGIDAPNVPGPEDVPSVDPVFLSEVGITQHLSSNRRNGLSNVTAKILGYAELQKS